MLNLQHYVFSINFVLKGHNQFHHWSYCFSCPFKIKAFPSIFRITPQLMYRLFLGLKLRGYLVTQLDYIKPHTYVYWKIATNYQHPLLSHTYSCHHNGFSIHLVQTHHSLTGAMEIIQDHSIPNRRFVSA